MSYTKGVWEVGRGGYCVVSTEPVPEVNGSDAVEYYGGHLIGESMSKSNARRIADCVNACDGMENPVDEIAKLRYEIAMLYRLIDDKDSEIARMAIIAAKAENNLADALDEIDELRASSAGWK